MDGRSEWVPGRVGPDLGLAGPAIVASARRSDVLSDRAFRGFGAYCREGGDRWEGVGVRRLTIGITSGGLAAQTATKVHDALDESLGQPPWPDLRVLGVVPRDVDMLVPAGSA